MKKIGLVIASTLAACSASNNIVVSQQTAVAITQQQQATANVVMGYATTSPPSAGTSMGVQSTLQAGTLTIPISNVEVYTFQASLDSGGADETLYWAAADDGTVYVWGQENLTCVDDNGDPTGETGVADFILETDGTGYGWMEATDSCGYTTYFGCSSDGSSETCGGCDFDSESIACAAVSS